MPNPHNSPVLRGGRGFEKGQRDGRLRTNIGNVSTLDDAVATFNRTERRKGKTIIRVRP